MPTVPRPLSDQFRDAIRESGLSVRELGKRADIDDGMLHRFLSGERSLTLTTADRLGEALGLRLVEARSRRAARAHAGTRGAG